MDSIFSRASMPTAQLAVSHEKHRKASTGVQRVPIALSNRVRLDVKAMAVRDPKASVDEEVRQKR
jgi:hypothetical protein